VPAITLDDATFDQAVLGAESPVLVDFWAPWCAPCRLVSPVVEAVGEEQAGRLVVAKLNIDDNTGVASRYSIFSIPTLILFRGGRDVMRVVGFVRKEELERRIAAALAA